MHSYFQQSAFLWDFSYEKHIVKFEEISRWNKTGYVQVGHTYSDNSIKNTVLRPNWQYKASTAEMAENRYS